ncbi:MAG: methyltransferase domain-containing protein [Patescibacteria group bacterium]
MLSQIQPLLKCPDCSADFDAVQNGLRCRACRRFYHKKNDSLMFVSPAPEAGENASFMPNLKKFLKKHPKLFFALYYTLGVFVGKSAKTAVKIMPKGSVILNIASGPKIIRDDVINVDIEPYAGVAVCADIMNLPFKDEAADAVICESSFEHFKNPEKALLEMKRVLKNGGLIYASLPFICGFHASPDDYFRWTEAGIAEFFKEFETKELAVGWGPTYALTAILREWLALVLSFNSVFLHEFLAIVFTVIFAPFNFLDHILARYHSAKNISFGFYYIGIKK